MKRLKRLAGGAFALALLVSGSAGCASRITNLTPTTVPAEPGGMYQFEAEWDTNQRSVNLLRDDVKGYVVIDQKFHPMARVARMEDRWEARIPIPDPSVPVYYYYKWDYGEAGFGRVNPNSVRSPQYRLQVLGPAN